MNPIHFACRAGRWLPEQARTFDFLAPLMMRLYLAPIFIEAGANKLALPSLWPKDGVVQWFDYGLGLPWPTLMAALAGWTELFGGILLLLGLAVRWISIPLMVTMLVATVTVHWKYGWLAIAGHSLFFSTERTQAALERLAAAKDILRAHGDYAWLTEHGGIVMLNNGIEFAATYFIMLAALLAFGAGRYASLDYWLARRCRHA